MLLKPRVAPRAVVTLCLLVAALAVAPLSRSVAQETTPALRLLSQPLWHSEDDELDLVLRVENGGAETLDGFAVRVLVYDRVGSRSALRESFDERPQDLIDGEDRFFLETSVRPGEARTVALRMPLASLGFSEDDESGVYPLEVSLEAAPPEQPLDSLTTQVIFYPHSVEAPLDLVVVWPLSALPARAPDGTFLADPLTRRSPLEDATGPQGWLAELVGLLRERRGLRLGLAPTPRLIEELADMANGFSRVVGDRRARVRADQLSARRARASLAAVRSLVDDPRIEALLTPYSAPDLPSTASGSALLRQRQWREGANVLNEVLGVRVGTDLSRTWLYPPGGRLDAPSLELLQHDHAPPSGAIKTFFAADAIEQPSDPSEAGCPRRPATFACPLRVRTVEGDALGFVTDPGLQESFAGLAGSAGERRLWLQRLLAETAMIREEFPGVEGRMVHLEVPPLWRPPTRLLQLFLKGLEAAPWLRTRLPAEGLRAAREMPPRRVVERAPGVRQGLDADYLQGVQQASAVVESFSAVEPPPAAVERLRRDVLVAQSRLWWIEGPLAYLGEAYAREAAEQAQRYLDRIQLGGRDSITLTSQRQDIPLVLFNENPFPVQVRVHLRSPSLDFVGDWERGRQVPVPPGNQPLTIHATARQSGEFPLDVRLMTPDDTLISQNVIRIRSTQFNRIALGITFGALAFLVLFYAARALRQRRESTDLRSSDSPTG